MLLTATQWTPVSPRSGAGAPRRGPPTDACTGAAPAALFTGAAKPGPGTPKPAAKASISSAPPHASPEDALGACQSPIPRDKSAFETAAKNVPHHSTPPVDQLKTFSDEEKKMYSIPVKISGVDYYICADQVGSGSFGGVYQAWLPSTQSPGKGWQVAVKVIDPKESDQAAFEAERYLLAEAAKSPHGLGYYGAGTLKKDGVEDTPNAIVMEYCPRGSLLRKRNHLRRGFKKWDPAKSKSPSTPAELQESCLHICWQLLQATESIHEAGIAHRDLKPENFALTAEGELKAIDFGLAYRCQEPLHDDVGTRAFESPEQLTKSAYGMKTDVFSIGVMILEMISGYSAIRWDDEAKEALDAREMSIDDLCASRRSIATTAREKYQKSMPHLAKLLLVLEELVFQPELHRIDASQLKNLTALLFRGGISDQGEFKAFDDYRDALNFDTAAQLDATWTTQLAEAPALPRTKSSKSSAPPPVPNKPKDVNLGRVKSAQRKTNKSRRAKRGGGAASSDKIGR